MFSMNGTWSSWSHHIHNQERGDINPCKLSSCIQLYFSPIIQCRLLFLGKSAIRRKRRGKVFPYKLIYLRISDTGVSTAQLDVPKKKKKFLLKLFPTEFKFQVCVNLPIKVIVTLYMLFYADKWFLQEIESLKIPSCPMLFKYWAILAFTMIFSSGRTRSWSGTIWILNL